MSKLTIQKITPDDYKALEQQGLVDMRTEYYLTDGTIYVGGIKFGDPEESDPTVPLWAKQENKPNYSADEVGAVDADNEMSFAQIDSYFKSVFGI